MKWSTPNSTNSLESFELLAFAIFQVIRLESDAMLQFYSNIHYRNHSVTHLPWLFALSVYFSHFALQRFKFSHGKFNSMGPLQIVINKWLFSKWGRTNSRNNDSVVSVVVKALLNVGQLIIIYGIKNLLSTDSYVCVYVSACRFIGTTNDAKVSVTGP